MDGHAFSELSQRQEAISRQREELEKQRKQLSKRKPSSASASPSRECWGGGDGGGGVSYACPSREWHGEEGLEVAKVRCRGLFMSCCVVWGGGHRWACSLVLV